MNAFDNYTENAPNANGVETPIGINVLSFNKNEVINLYAQQKLGATKETKEKNNNKEYNDQNQNNDQGDNNTNT